MLKSDMRSGRPAKNWRDISFSLPPLFLPLRLSYWPLFLLPSLLPTPTSRPTFTCTSVASFQSFHPLGNLYPANISCEVLNSRLDPIALFQLLGQAQFCGGKPNRTCTEHLIPPCIPFPTLLSLFLFWATLMPLPFPTSFSPSHLPTNHLSSHLQQYLLFASCIPQLSPQLRLKIAYLIPFSSILTSPQPCQIY